LIFLGTIVGTLALIATLYLGLRAAIGHVAALVTALAVGQGAMWAILLPILRRRSRLAER